MENTRSATRSLSVSETMNRKTVFVHINLNILKIDLKHVLGRFIFMYIDTYFIFERRYVVLNALKIDLKYMFECCTISKNTDIKTRYFLEKLGIFLRESANILDSFYLV